MPTVIHPYNSKYFLTPKNIGNPDSHYCRPLLLKFNWKTKTSSPVRSLGTSNRNRKTVQINCFDEERTVRFDVVDEPKEKWRREINS